MTYDFIALLCLLHLKRNVPQILASGSNFTNRWNYAACTSQMEITIFIFEIKTHTVKVFTLIATSNAQLSSDRMCA